MIEDILHLVETIRVGNTTLDEKIFKAMGWKYHAPVRRGMRQYHGYWERGNEQVATVPPVSTETVEAKKLVPYPAGEVIKSGYEYIEEKFVISFDSLGSFPKKEVYLSANTRPLVHCAAALYLHGISTGEIK